VNCCVPPAATEGITGVTAIETSVAGVTVSKVFPLTLPLVALIVVLPVSSAEARPALLIVAAVAFDDAHVTFAVTVRVEASLYVPVAVNCCIPPAASDGFSGVIAIDTSFAGATGSLGVETEPQPIAPKVASISSMPGQLQDRQRLVKLCSTASDQDSA